MSERRGIGVLGALGLIFVTLKLIGVTNWSWWVVTLPFYGVPLLIVLLAGLLVLTENN